MSRIVSVQTHVISVPRPQPVRTAHEQNRAWSVILTEVRTNDGLVGYGEIHGAPMPRICEWVSRFSDIVCGMDALANLPVWEKLFALTSRAIWPSVPQICCCRFPLLRCGRSRSWAT